MTATVLPTAPRGRDAEIIGLVGLAHGTSHFYHLMLPPLFPWLIEEFALSYTQLGFLMTVFFVISGVGQAFAGFVVDRVGARPVLYFGVATLSASGIVLGLADGYAGLLAAAAVAGLGNCVFHPADFTLLNRRVSPPRLGHAFSMHGVAGNLGWAAGPVFMASIATGAGWHVAGFAAAAVGAGMLAVLVWRRDALDDAAAAVVAPASAQARTAHPFGFLRSGLVWGCFAFFVLVTGAFGILQSYGPVLLHEVYGITLIAATAGLTAYLLGSAAGMLAGGFVAARHRASERNIAVALAAAAAVALLLASGWPPPALAVPLMALIGFGAGIAGPSRDLLVRKAATAQFGGAAFGRVYGFVYAGLDSGLALSPLLVGPLLDGGHFQVALFGVAVLQVSALLSALAVGHRAQQVAAPGV